MLNKNMSGNPNDEIEIYERYFLEVSDEKHRYAENLIQYFKYFQENVVDKESLIALRSRKKQAEIFFTWLDRGSANFEVISN